MIESAYAHAHGWTKEAHRGRLGALWAGYAQVAAADPLAWDRSAPDANTIVEASDDNRMVAFPYTRLLCSQWNVDQAAALVFASAGAARELGVASDRFVFPLAAAESNAMIPMPERREIHRWPAFALAASRALDLAGVSLDDIRLMEIYSCFPSAVQAQLGELGLSDERPLTVTGGMTFAGGPLNNFVLQSTAAMAERIRESGDTGLVTGVSGLLTKPAAALWSSAPPREGFRSADVSEESLHATQIHPMSVDERGHATIVGSTVSYERGRPPRALAVLQLDDGSRTVAGSDDPDDVEALTSTDPVGLRAVALEPGRFTAQTS
jgi:acetyl-CoA C-acetyltransferase